MEDDLVAWFENLKEEMTELAAKKKRLEAEIAKLEAQRTRADLREQARRDLQALDDQYRAKRIEFNKLLKEIEEASGRLIELQNEMDAKQQRLDKVSRELLAAEGKAKQWGLVT